MRKTIFIALTVSLSALFANQAKNTYGLWTAEQYNETVNQCIEDGLKAENQMPELVKETCACTFTKVSNIKTYKEFELLIERLEKAYSENKPLSLSDQEFVSFLQNTTIDCMSSGDSFDLDRNWHDWEVSEAMDNCVEEDKASEILGPGFDTREVCKCLISEISTLVTFNTYSIIFTQDEPSNSKEDQMLVKAMVKALKNCGYINW